MVTAVSYNEATWDSKGECKQNKVYLDIEVEKDDGTKEGLGKIIIKLSADVVPKTAENFRRLCTGEMGSALHYQSCVVHRVVKDFMIQTGDIVLHNGAGGRSIYGPTFPDENFNELHGGVGTVSMTNFGPDSNSSQFQISLMRDRQTGWMNGVHVVVGVVEEESLPILEAINAEYGSTNGEPTRGKVTIVKCDQMP